MISYLDMTFCRGDGCANASQCFRFITPTIAEAAKNSGLPICQFSEPKKLECYEAPAPESEVAK